MKETEYVNSLLNKLVHSGWNLNVKLAQDILSIKDLTIMPLINIVKSKRYWHSKDENQSIAPLTALHLLSITKENIALEAIIYAIYNYRKEIDEWFYIMSFLLANFGKESFERISKLLFDKDLEYWIKEPVARALIIIGKSNNDIDLQNKTIDILKNVIILETDRTSKSFLVTLLADLKDPISLNFIKSLFDNGEIDEEVTTFNEVLDVYNGSYDESIQLSHEMKDPWDYFKVKDFFSSKNNEDIPQSYTFLNDDYNLDQNLDAAFDDKSHASNYNGTAKTLTAKIGRNDLCPCGSRKKYKKCCINKTVDIISNTSAADL